MPKYENYKWVIDNIVANLREEESVEDRMKIIEYITDMILSRCIDAGLLSIHKICERCNNA